MWGIWQVLWNGVWEVLRSGSGVYDKCSDVALDLLMSGSRVTPQIKFMFIYDIMWGMKSVQEWLRSCSRNQVCVHIWHYVGYMSSAPDWLWICSGVAPELLQKSSLCSYMTLCEVYDKYSGVGCRKYSGVVPVYMISTLVWLQICYEVAPELLRKSSLYSYMAPWLQSFSGNQVYVHIWHHVWYIVSALEWFQLFRKSSLCSCMTLCGYMTMNGSRVTPEIKFMFIYGTMWGIW